MAFADDFDGLLIDLDGVVWEGRELLPGAAGTLRALLDAGKEIVFVTNNSVRAPASYAERLRGFEIPVENGWVLTGGAVTARLAAEGAGPGSTAFVIGAPGFKEMVAAAGLELLEGEAGQGAGAVVVSGHREFD
jgi:glycerol-1-phosphatase